MNRRTYLKYISSLGALSVFSFTVFKWYDISKAIDPKEILAKEHIIAELAELIIPETNSPGAKSALVHKYIVNVLLNCNSIEQQNKFLSGINELEKYSLEQYELEFLKCSNQQKTSILKHFESDSGYSLPILNKINNKFLGQPFFTKLKNLTIEGYCISQKGATIGLAYDYIPSTYQSCIPLKLGQKSWATK